MGGFLERTTKAFMNTLAPDVGLRVLNLPESTDWGMYLSLDHENWHKLAKIVFVLPALLVEAAPYAAVMAAILVSGLVGGKEMTQINMVMDPAVEATALVAFGLKQVANKWGRSLV